MTPCSIHEIPVLIDGERTRRLFFPHRSGMRFSGVRKHRCAGVELAPCVRVVGHRHAVAAARRQALCHAGAHAEVEAWHAVGADEVPGARHAVLKGVLERRRRGVLDQPRVCSEPGYVALLGLDRDGVAADVDGTFCGGWAGGRGEGSRHMKAGSSRGKWVRIKAMKASWRIRKRIRSTNNQSNNNKMHVPPSGLTTLLLSWL